MNPKPILYGALILAVGVITWLFFEQNQVKKKLASMSHQIQLLELKSEADDLFIRGNNDEAFSHYQQYDSLANDTLLNLRTAQYRQPATSSSTDQIAELTAKLHRQEQLLREYEVQKENHEANIASGSADDVRLLQNEIAALKHKLAALQNHSEVPATSKGILRFASSKNGSVTYFGDLARGKANGEGFGYWKSGSTYEGMWKDNQRHGKGVFSWADGEKYEGEYQNDQRHGYGIYTAKAGRYEGQWLNDMRHGEGYLYETNGKLKTHGIWQKDKLVKTLK